MKRTLAALALSVALVQPAFAGGMAEPVMEQQIQEETRQGARAGILVPILALVLFALAISNDEDEPPG